VNDAFLRWNTCHRFTGGGACWSAVPAWPVMQACATDYHQEVTLVLHDMHRAGGTFCCAYRRTVIRAG